MSDLSTAVESPAASPHTPEPAALRSALDAAGRLLGEDRVARAAGGAEQSRLLGPNTSLFRSRRVAAVLRPLTAGQAAGIVQLFSRDPDSPAIREVLGHGGRATTVIDGWVSVLTPSSDALPLVELVDVPMTLAGLSRYNVENALAAASAIADAGPRSGPDSALPPSSRMRLARPLDCALVTRRCSWKPFLTWGRFASATWAVSCCSSCFSLP